MAQYLVDVGEGSENYYGWEDYNGLKKLCEYNNTELEDAEYITGYNCDSYADAAADIIEGIWEEYTEECEDEDKTPSWDDCWNNYIWVNSEYQLCHTWVRVTNIHIEDDENIKKFAKESDYCTMSEKLGIV